MGIGETLDRLMRDWSQPRRPYMRGKEVPMPMACSCERASGAPVSIDVARVTLPESVRQLWQHVEWAKLFRDVTYGQWGLVLLSPDRAVELTRGFTVDRDRYHQPGDLIVGEFLGDSDLLLVRSDRDADDFGQVFIVLPTEPREDWPRVADDLADFVHEFGDKQGDKFWETNWS